MESTYNKKVINKKVINYIATVRKIYSTLVDIEQMKHMVILHFNVPDEYAKVMVNKYYDAK